MPIVDKNGRVWQYRGGRKGFVYLVIDNKYLASLFKVSAETIRRWVKQKRLNPYSLDDIIEKLNNPKELDKRFAIHKDAALIETVGPSLKEDEKAQ